MISVSSLNVGVLSSKEFSVNPESAMSHINFY